MKKILLTSVLGSALILGACSGEEVTSESENNSEELEQLQSENDELKTKIEELENKLTEQEEAEETENDEIEENELTENDAGTRTNPIEIGETGTISIFTYTDDDAMDEVTGAAELTVDHVVRGDEAISILKTEYSEPEEAPENMEWVVFDVKFNLTELSDEDEKVTFTDDFEVITEDGSTIEKAYTTFDEEFGVQDTYSGGTAEGKVAVHAPAGEPFIIKYDDYMRAEAYFKVN